MHAQRHSPAVHLAQGQVLTLDDAAGARISSRAGTLWVTEEGAFTDHIVESGASFTLRRDGRTVVQALAPALVDIQ
jgi:hypothetical protein